MAVNYQIPPWIKAPDLAGDYARGLQLGQQAAQESQRLQMQQEENQRAHLMEQQRLQVDKAYKDQQLALDKQKVDQAAQLAQIKVQESARALDSQKKYTDFVNAGGSPLEGLLKFGPTMDSGSLAGLSSLAKLNQPAFVPSETTTPQGTRMVQTSSGHYQVIRPPKEVQSDLEKFDVSDLKSRLKKATTDLEKIPIDDLTQYDKGPKEATLLKDFQRQRNLVDGLRSQLAKKSVDKDELRRLAHHAIAARAPEDKVKARYKQLTGEDLDSTNTTDETTDEEE